MTKQMQILPFDTYSNLLVVSYFERNINQLQKHLFLISSDTFMLEGCVVIKHYFEKESTNM